MTTSIELAVLGYDSANGLRALRNKMIGTSTIRQSLPDRQPHWGSHCLKLLAAIENHTSKASRSYYIETHLQYFDDLYRSLKEIGRCLRPTGQCILVVQDSYYKELHNDLPSIVSDMSNAIGWILHERSNFPVTRSMTGINPTSKRYRAQEKVTESVLWFSANGSEEN